MGKQRTLTYFVADVHLGLDVKDPSDREARFVSFLRSLPAEETDALYLLGDVWDFWYEYRDVVPKGYVRVFSALLDLMDAGVVVVKCFAVDVRRVRHVLHRDFIQLLLHQQLSQSVANGSFCFQHPAVRLFSLHDSSLPL